MDSVGFEISCKDCGISFYICKSCYRGQVYCSEECRKKGYQKTRRTAQKKYLRSPEAREDHREAQQRYRNRDRQGVLESRVIDQSSNSSNEAIVLNLTLYPIVAHDSVRTPVVHPYRRCQTCGRCIAFVFRSEYE